MDFEERRLLKYRISAIQREREERARRMHVKDAYGERLYLGGGSRPVTDQNRSGYPSFWDLGNTEENRVQTRYICGCDWSDPHIQGYGATMLPNGNITNKRYDREGYEVCPIHGARLQGWASTGKNDPPIGAALGPVPKGEIGSGTADHRDNRDPATVGEEWLARQQGNGTPPSKALSKPAPMATYNDPVTGADEG